MLTQTLPHWCKRGDLADAGENGATLTKPNRKSVIPNPHRFA